MVDSDGDDGTEEEEVDGAQSGERKQRKTADPIMPSGANPPTSRSGTCVGTLVGAGVTKMPHKRVTGERELLKTHFDFSFFWR